ncbi:MAG: RNA polymerase sigma factor [Clostridia bacterium]|nr:RNA polymerase sigma factor [Clostridia bacterium]
MDFVKGPDDPENIEERITHLVDTYQVSLKRMCCVWLKDYALAEDAVQETFIKAYHALPAFRGECSEKTWLVRIAVNVCRNIKRGGWFRHVNRAVDIDNLPEPSVPFREYDDTLIRAVSSLPDRYREIILLYYFQDMTMGEISDALNISVSTVSRRLSAAQKQLRAQLERE